MEVRSQHQAAFYLTGRMAGPDLSALTDDHKPALFARHLDLTDLRYDYPVVLNATGSADTAVVSLSGLVDDEVERLSNDPDRGRIARLGYRIEREIRRDLTVNGPDGLAAAWNAAVERLAADDDSVRDSASRLWMAFGVNGEIIDVSIELTDRTVRHLWSAVQAAKAARFRLRAERLLLKLRSILAAEIVDSPVGRAPERLKAAVGTSFAGSFDFEALSSILVEAKPGVGLSDSRRRRISSLICTLEQQRFYPLEAGEAEPFRFDFAKCSDALTAYNERHDDAVALAKALAVADLEVNGEYRQSAHDVLFEHFGANGLDAPDLAQLPDYLICTDTKTLDPAEMARMVEMLAAGLPFKILVRTDDILESSPVVEGHVAMGLRSRQLVDTAIGMTDVFVFQASASHLFRKCSSLLKGLNYGGPALFSVFSGVTGHTGDLPAYLVAAAAVDSRVFPTIVFDPSAGADWAARLSVDDNPSPDDDWPVGNFGYEDGKLGSQTEELAFTAADFLVTDDRVRHHYALVPAAHVDSSMVSVPEALEIDLGPSANRLPSVVLVDGDNRLRHAIIDERLLGEVRRCRAMWHSLQELGGIHNSHAVRLLARERDSRTLAAVLPAASTVETTIEAVLQTAAPETSPITPALEAPPVSPSEDHGDDPYIDTARCTTCNECTQINSRMFAYNENKQAYIADPDAGTFRQLVEAAEGCQVSIIHPGKPRNPKEPGLEDLMRRAAEFI